MAQQKKMSQVEKTKHKMRLEQEKIQKQREAALGESGKTYKRLLLAKITMLALFPVIFFLYSPLLFPLILAYAGTFFVSSALEKKANKDLKKSLWIKIPRWDGLIALILVAVVLFGLILTVGTTNSKKSVFEDKTRDEIVTMLQSGTYGSDAKSNAVDVADILNSNGVNLTRGQKYTLQFFTLYTGHRQFFIPKNNAVFGFGRTVNSESNDSEQVTIIIKAKGNGKEIRIENVGSAGLSDVPFMLGFTRFLFVVNIGVLLTLVLAGVYIVRSLKLKEQEIFKSPAKKQTENHTKKGAKTEPSKISNAAAAPPDTPEPEIKEDGEKDTGSPAESDTENAPSQTTESE